MVPSVLPVRRSSIRRRSPTPRTRLAPVRKIRRRISRVNTILSTRLHTVWLLSPKSITPSISVSGVVACQLLKYGGEFLLHDFYTLLDNRVRLEVAYRFELEEELGGDRVIIEGLAVLGLFFPFCVARFWPRKAARQQQLHKLHHAAVEDGFGTVYLPFLNRILLVPIIHMLQLIMRIILKTHRCRWRPLGMLLCNPFLRNTLHPHLLPFPQLTNHSPIPRLIRNNRITHPLIRPRLSHNQIPRIHLHDLIAGASRRHCESHAAVLAVLVAVAVASVEHVFDLLAVERDEAEAVGDKFIGEDGGVGFDFDEVDGHRGDFGEDGAAEGVGEGEVDV